MKHILSFSTIAHAVSEKTFLQRYFSLSDNTISIIQALHGPETDILFSTQNELTNIQRECVLHLTRPTQARFNMRELSVRIIPGEYAQGLFWFLDDSKGAGAVIINGYEYGAFEGACEVALAENEVDRYRADCAGRNWDDVVWELVNEAIEQIRGTGRQISEENVGDWLAKNGHFLLPEEITNSYIQIRRIRR